MAISTTPRGMIAATYEAAAQEYLRSLPLEHFMEATPQATQRKITLESLDLLVARRPDVHVFNELLVQYPVPGQRRPGQVCPDNMVVISTQPIEATTSFNVPLESAAPFWVLEYVSKNNKRKDYEDNFDKYERDLKVPYYLTFYPDNQELTLYRHTGSKHVTVKPNKHGRLEIPELDLEIGLVDGWVRYWHQGELLPLPADLERDLKEALRAAAAADERAKQANERAKQANEQAKQANERAEQADVRAVELQRTLETEQEARRTAEEELTRLRAALAQQSPQ